jgi:hypothetical protein
LEGFGTIKEYMPNSMGEHKYDEFVLSWIFNRDLRRVETLEPVISDKSEK